LFSIEWGDGPMKRVFLFTLAMIFIFCAYTYSQEETATIFEVKGDVKVVPRGRNIGVVCEEGMVVNSGDWIKTGPGSTVTLSFDADADNVVTIEENSLIIMKLDGYFKIQLLTGEIYAILENVEHGEAFRVLTPSVVTESMSSGWGARSDGTYTNVVVFDNRVFLVGLNKDGTVKKKKFWIEEGYQRKTINFEDPGELKPIPENLLSWFREQVVAHHLEKTIVQQTRKQGIDTSEVKEDGEKAAEGAEKEQQYTAPSGNGKIIVDGEEINLLDFLYKQRLQRESTAVKKE